MLRQVFPRFELGYAYKHYAYKKCEICFPRFKPSPRPGDCPPVDNLDSQWSGCFRAGEQNSFDLFGAPIFVSALPIQSFPLHFSSMRPRLHYKLKFDA